MSKYGNVKTIAFGCQFDSKREAQRYAELRLLEMAGEITDLQRQVPFVLIPAQKDAAGKAIEREVRYIADFTYTDKKTNVRVVEDAKGLRTKEYIIKRKLMLYKYGIKIQEV